MQLDARLLPSKVGVQVNLLVTGHRPATRDEATTGPPTTTTTGDTTKSCTAPAPSRRRTTTCTVQRDLKALPNEGSAVVGCRCSVSLFDIRVQRARADSAATSHSYPRTRSNARGRLGVRLS